MKKIVVLLLIAFASTALFAQETKKVRSVPEAAEIVKKYSPVPVNEQKMKQAIKEALETVNESAFAQKGVEYPTITMGKNKFVIDRVLKEKVDGNQIWTYYYVPAEKPLTYKLDTVFTSGLPDADYTVTGRVNSLLIVGPRTWRNVDFEVAGIEIVIYENNVFHKIKSEWTLQFSEDCVYYGDKKHGNVERVAGLWHTPTKAYLFEGGRTAVVYVDAAAKKYGPYKRECNKWNLDALFKAQPEFNKINIFSFPQMQYPAKNAEK